MKTSKVIVPEENDRQRSEQPAVVWKRAPWRPRAWEQIE